MPSLASAIDWKAFRCSVSFCWETAWVILWVVLLLLVSRVGAATALVAVRVRAPARAAAVIQWLGLRTGMEPPGERRPGGSPAVTRFTVIEE